MKTMDLKAKNVLNQYKYLLENDLFLETDIIGFLILIREYIDKGKYNQICDMCDFIAHRFRDSGFIVDDLNKAIQNNYTVNSKNKVIEHGYDLDKIIKQLIRVCNDLDILINEKIAKNIMICYVSLLQFSEYKLKNNKKGIVQFLKGSDNSLLVCIKENDINAPSICFIKIPKCTFVHDTHYGFIYDVLYLKRVNGSFILKNNNDENYIVF